MAGSRLPCVELGVELGDRQAEYSVIWLHGLGASGHDFVPMVPELQLPDSAAIRFVFPHAPQRPVTINGGMVMSAWYDIVASEFDVCEDAAGIRHSQQQIEALIDHEIESGVPADHIVLAGFSQGGALALHTGLRYPRALAGIMVLSGYLPLAKCVADELSAANRAIPIFMAHGEHDPIVPLALAGESWQQLEALGYQPEWHCYEMQHSVCIEEIWDISRWLRTVFQLETAGD
jgi:phospholipase/carboxylesterase